MTNITPQTYGDGDGASYLNIAGAATTVVKGYPGKLVRITNNKKVASGVITIYDNASAASGTKIGTITNPGTLLDNAQTYEYGCHFKNGLTIVTSAADDLTVVFE
ncbi:MAG: hypothetical protein E6Q97_15395 [Desulfurellales bacterium]|nr:MAG: hypothetical protein E6Q97_15395 [Desulfurellales bacterium]